MLWAFAKAFADTRAPEQRLRRQGYGNLHLVLAGCYFRAGEYRRFAWHSVRCLLLTPSRVVRFMTYPYRLLRRSRHAQE